MCTAGNKVCSFCKQEKPEGEFFKDKSRKDGLSSRCKNCKFITRHRKPKKDGHKVCSRCGEEKIISDFNKQVTGKFGVSSLCRLCERRQGRERYYKDHKETRLRRKAYNDSTKELSKQRYRRYRKTNKDTLKQREKKYIENNRDKINAKSARRRATSKKSYPFWAKNDELHRFIIEEIYDLSLKLSDIRGTQYHVDHKVPLVASVGKNKQVACGLHVWWNLQPIEGSVNDSKNCYSWPDMWDYSDPRYQRELEEMLLEFK